jgi:glutathione S-transferase
MQLIGAMASPYVTRVVMFARIKGIDLPLVDAPGGSPRSEEYLALTPIGKIPSLEVDGRILAESEVVCEYLEDAYPKHVRHAGESPSLIQRWEMEGWRRGGAP